MLRPKRILSLAIVGLAVLVAGCASFDGLESSVVPPTLIEKAPLPPPPQGFASQDFYIRMELLIGVDGSVRHVTLTKATGDREWDAAAIERIMQWKYSPALANDKPIQMRIIQTARVVSTQPVMMDLSQMTFATFTKADTAYRLLKAGAAFDSLAVICASEIHGVTNGHIGNVDIHRYPDEIQAELRSLKSGDFTAPLPLGPYFAIFQRH